jgi:hypothetical protein
MIDILNILNGYIDEINHTLVERFMILFLLEAQYYLKYFFEKTLSGIIF